ncbi:glycosyltransferase family 2 protein [Sulfurifustis variabilis]|uniref:glycosyltransferase family 2 protein n=1 Tax=Sulfurifustis variabilis TaxID=1675686 RepID=UPI0014746083|nr:glycosyltransferase family 2 protein [Sulfurifustis variabilis]
MTDSRTEPAPGEGTQPGDATAGGVSGHAGAGRADALVTVVIPTYNRAALLPKAIASVLRQTHARFEIVVVDDGSTDATATVVSSLQDPRIRYVRHERNRGLPAARNTGIRAARGEYVAFIDDDDEWREDKLERQLQVIGRYDAVLATGVADGYPLRIHRRPEISLDDLRKGSFNPSSLLAKTSVLRDVMFDESLRQGEDWDAFIRIGKRYSIGWLPEPLLIYNEGSHVRMTNEAKTTSVTELERRMAVLRKHREFFGERWYEYHVADNLLSYIATRADRLSCVRYAIRRCGVLPVATVLADKTRRFVVRRFWKYLVWRGRVPGPVNADKA